VNRLPAPAVMDPTAFNRQPRLPHRARRRRRDPNRLQRLVDDDVSVERAYEQMMKARPTPNATIETVKQAVRDRGVSALDEKQTRERLQRCDPAAIAEIDQWILKRGIHERNT
jgi:hypothetical protein